MRKDENPVRNASQEIDDLQNMKILNSVGICNNTVAYSSNVGDPILNIITTLLDTDDCFEEPNQKD